MATSSTQNPSPSYFAKLLQELQAEAVAVAQNSGRAFATFAWIWPVKGLVFSILHPSVILSVRGALAKSFGSAAILFSGLAFFTYVPQAALLSLFTGPLGPILAVFLIGAESIFLLTLLAKPLFLAPALQHVFDAALVENGQRQLVQVGKTRKSSAGVTGGAGAVVRALQGDGVARYLLTLPLNIIPFVGTVSFLAINGQRAGPGWHARYFQLKGFDSTQRKAFVEKHRPEYTAFGIGALVFSFVPIVGLVFTFTNTVGAALWAADLEAKSNILEGKPPSPTAKKSSEDVNKPVEGPAVPAAASKKAD